MSEQSRLAPESLEAYIQERELWLADAVEVVTGSRDGDPMVVFPKPSPVRNEMPNPDLTYEQEASLREIAGRFGFGGEIDIPSGAAVELIEAGLAWKIEAEAAIASGVRVYAGSPDRPTNEKEATHMAGKLAEDEEMPANEYALADRIARLDPGFSPLKEPVVMPFGYDISDGFSLVTEPTGQYVQIGHNNGQPVYLLRVDRENYIDDDGNAKFRNRPEGVNLMGFLSAVLERKGDSVSSVGIVTTNTYPSRAIDVVRAGLANGRQYTVGMYGRQTLANVRGESVAAPAEANQIPAELYVITEKLRQLQAEAASLDQQQDS